MPRKALGLEPGLGGPSVPSPTPGRVSGADAPPE